MKIIDSDYGGHNPFSAITPDGYKIIITDNNLKNGILPSYVCANNPYSIDNIHNYIKQNHLNVKLLSTEYKNATSLLNWECSCGSIFQTSWKAFKRGKHCCDACSKDRSRMKLMRSDEDVISILGSYGYQIIKRDKSIPISQQKIVIEDADGYKYKISWGHFLCGHKKPWKFGPSNPYSIDNINRLFYMTGRKDYKCISKEYINNTTPLDILHIPCGTVFQMRLVDIQKKSIDGSGFFYNVCPECFPKRRESLHASILKQVFVHEYPDTILEDKSCINPMTRHVLPTDIVNHKNKIAIEIQSDYHDKESQKIKDSIKRDYWINRGYSFYSPDIRDYSVLGMIQLFFPNIDHIPEYIDYNYSCNSDVKIVQECLNDYCTVNETSSFTGIKNWIIYDMIHRERVVLPADYKSRENNKKKIVQLDSNFNIIEEYDSRADAWRKYGYDQSTLGKAVHGKLEKAYGSIWMFKTDYLNFKELQSI